MQRQFSIHGVSLSVSSNDQAFLSFADSYFLGFGTIFETAQPALIRIDAKWLPGFTFSLRERHTETDGIMYGSGISYDSAAKVMTISDRGWTAVISESNGVTSVALSYKKNFWRHMADIVSAGQAETQRRYYRAALRFAPQTLAFQFLAREGIRMHSGAAVLVHGKAYALCGLPGAGKSTLASFLQQRIGAEILTENFILTDGISVFPFPEGNAVSSLGPQQLAGIYIVSHGDAHSVSELSEAMGHDRMNVIDMVTGELPEQSKVAAIALAGIGATQASSQSVAQSYSVPFKGIVVGKDLAETADYFSSL